MSGPRTRWLNRTVLGIGLASLLSDAGHEMATAALAQLVVALSAAPWLLGVIEGVADLASSAAKLISGRLTDRIRHRKLFAACGYFVTALGMASFGLATAWWHVLLGRTLGWIGRGARSPVRNVLLADATTPDTYGRAFGLERAMDSLGAVVGPALFIWLLPSLGLKGVFAVTLVPGLAAALCIALLVREAPHLTGTVKSLDPVPLPPTYKRFLKGVGFAGLGDFSNTLLILFATEAFEPLYGLEVASRIAVGYYTGFNVVYAGTCYVAGAFADRWPKRLVLAWGYVVAAVPAIALLWPNELPSNFIWVKFVVVFGVSGVYMGVWETVENAAAAELLPREIRGWGFGVLATVNGLGDFVSSVLVAWLWVRVSPTAAMAWVIATSLGGAWLVARTRR